MIKTQNDAISMEMALILPFIGVSTRCSPPSLSPNDLYFTHLYNFAIRRMLCKWNHIVCDLLGLTFFTQHNTLEIQSSCWESVCYCTVTNRHKLVTYSPPNLLQNGSLSHLLQFWSSEIENLFPWGRIKASARLHSMPSRSFKGESVSLTFSSS